MSKDSNTILLVGGGLVAGYLLFPDKIKEAISGGGTTFGLDISDLLAGLSIGGGLLGKAGGAAGAVEDEAENIVTTVYEYIVPEGWLPPPPSNGGEGDGETDQPQAEEEGLVTRLRGKIATPAAVTAGAVTAYVTRGAPKVVTVGATKAITAVAPKVAAKGAVRAGLRFVPVLGQVYLVADVATTIWELVTGKSVLGSWLGWGELLRGDTPTERTPVESEVGQQQVSGTRRGTVAADSPPASIYGLTPSGGIAYSVNVSEGVVVASSLDSVVAVTDRGGGGTHYGVTVGETIGIGGA